MTSVCICILIYVMPGDSDKHGRVAQGPATPVSCYMYCMSPPDSPSMRLLVAAVHEY